MAAKTEAFTGFPIELLHFLHELEANNNRDWFATHKARYEQLWLAPSLSFITAMQPALARLSPAFLAVPKRVGGSLMRVYRDTRFSHDKRPYKTNVGIQFRHHAGKDVHAPGIYFHLDTEQPFLGVGIWRPDRDALDAIRQAMVQRPSAWKKSWSGSAFERDFERTGESLKRIPRGYDADSPLADDLKRKDHIAVSQLTLDECVSSDLIGILTARMKLARELPPWLCDALGLDF